MPSDLCLCIPRADTESTSEHLEALRKLSSDLEEQGAILEDLRDQKHALLPQLSLLDKELVRQQVILNSCRSYKHGAVVLGPLLHIYLSLTRWVIWSSAGLNLKP